MIGNEQNVTKPSLAAVNYSSAAGYQQSALAQTMENLALNSIFVIYNWLFHKHLSLAN
ncbi:hypothetical protein [Vibrio harveyi]|uniref:hypothetical protein n=1 Tax=Vibrio harveyi TaxID=669 RepID=UPI00028DD2A9|nr:hypothetical protein [Vibrio harveyi]EKM13880.1 hypothetical protein VCHENC01_1701 [Vibrio harveyi]GEA20563.1 hypothetical protein VH1807_contig00008-0081 [Vibrio harveyi]HDM8054436.1 hypothetical protein [Vibrio harveyi]